MGPTILKRLGDHPATKAPARWLAERLLLRFRDAEAERAWLTQADDQARGPVCIGLLVFAALIVLAALGDEPQGYTGWQTVVIMRIVVWAPLALIGAGLVSMDRMRGRVLDIAWSVAVLLTVSLIGLMVFAMPRSTAVDFPMYWAVLLLLVHVVAPLGLVRATAAGVAVVGGFFATLLHHGVTGSHFAAHATFLLFVWMLLIAASWMLESRARATFLAERRLRTRTNELSALSALQTSVLDTLSEGVCGLNADGVVTFANPAAAFLLERPAASIVGARFHQSFHDADADAKGTCVLCESNQGVHDLPTRLRLLDERVRWVECAARPTVGQGHLPSGDRTAVRVVSFRDVGRRREMEAQVRHNQKMKAIGVFVGGVAHEFNNLLTPIVGGVELAGKWLEPDHPLQPSLSDVGAAGDRAAALVRQLLALGCRTDIAPQTLDLSDLVSEALAFIRTTLDHRIETTFVPAHGAWAYADPGQVNQVLLNLCLNARDALVSDLDSGRPRRISISVGQVELAECATGLDPSARPGAWIELGVEDTGPGIDAEVLPHVFEPFFTTRTGGGRTGLGLAVVHGIVHQHGGWVSVDTTPGGGTRFRCMFPASTLAAVRDVERVPAPPRAAVVEARRVLLVDDEQLVREVTRSILEFAGFTVEDTPSGLVALQRMEAGYRPDVVVLDILMPELDGWQTLARIRALDPHIPVVMVSGYDAEAAELRPVRPDAYVRKPFRMEQLLGALERVMVPRAPATTTACTE